MTDRRTFLKAAAIAATAPLLPGCADTPQRELTWKEAAFRKTDRSTVAILAAQRYDSALVDVIRRGCGLCGVDVGGKRVVIKPNFVEFDPQSAINTHPVVIAAAIEAFRSMGARTVTVAEGSGHRRDHEYIAGASGLGDLLRDLEADYVDLNVDAVSRVTAASTYTLLGSLYLPRTVTDADLLVSMPKLKTHHYAGATLSMKNLFGIMPGSVYGWPKNVLHYQGIPHSILDINATLPVPRFNIIDGIIGMEGDGPIMGTPRPAGVLVFGADPVAVDATGARLMDLEPRRMGYLAEASRFLGNMEGEQIEQRGESLETFAQPFELIEQHIGLRPVFTGS